MVRHQVRRSLGWPSGHSAVAAVFSALTLGSRMPKLSRVAPGTRKGAGAALGAMVRGRNLPRHLCLWCALGARRQMPLRIRRREGNTPTSGTPPPTGILELAYFFALAAGKEVVGAIVGTPVVAVGLRLYLARIGAKSGWVRPYSVSLTTKSFISGALTLW